MFIKSNQETILINKNNTLKIEVDFSYENTIFTTVMLNDEYLCFFQDMKKNEYKKESLSDFQSFYADTLVALLGKAYMELNTLIFSSLVDGGIENTEAVKHHKSNLKTIEKLLKLKKVILSDDCILINNYSTEL